MRVSARPTTPSNGPDDTLIERMRGPERFDGELLPQYAQLFRRPSFVSFLLAGALQFAAPSTALVDPPLPRGIRVPSRRVGDVRRPGTGAAGSFVRAPNPRGGPVLRPPGRPPRPGPPDADREPPVDHRDRRARRGPARLLHAPREPARAPGILPSALGAAGVPVLGALAASSTLCRSRCRFPDWSRRPSSGTPTGRSTPSPRPRAAVRHGRGRGRHEPRSRIGTLSPSRSRCSWGPRSRCSGCGRTSR